MATLHLRLTPRGGAARIDRFEDGVLHCRVTSPPVDGAANQALIELLSKSFGVSRSRLTLVGGETSRVKRIDVEGVHEHDLYSWINAAINRTKMEKQRSDDAKS